MRVEILRLLLAVQPDVLPTNYLHRHREKHRGYHTIIATRVSHWLSNTINSRTTYLSLYRTYPGFHRFQRSYIPRNSVAVLEGVLCTSVLSVCGSKNEFRTQDYSDERIYYRTHIQNNVHSFQKRQNNYRTLRRHKRALAGEMLDPWPYAKFQITHAHYGDRINNLITRTIIICMSLQCTQGAHKLKGVQLSCAWKYIDTSAVIPSSTLATLDPGHCFLMWT